jgi:hypothetical protein
VNQVIAPALSIEERRFLYDQRNSEHFRVFCKAIAWAYSIEAARLITLPKDDLPRIQGVLQGFLGARGIISSQAFAGAPSEEELKAVLVAAAVEEAKKRAVKKKT